MRATRAVTDRGPSPGDEPAHTSLARWALALAAAAAVLIAAGLGALAVLGEGLGVLLSVGVVASLAGFLMGVVAVVRHERWALLLVPLSVFPVALAVLVLGEVLWWE